MESLRPNEDRAQIAVALIWIVMSIEILALISGYFQYDLLKFVSDGGNVTVEEASANDNRESLIGLLYVVVFVISGITFIRWFRRAYFNLHQMVDNLSHTEGWAAGAWFVPFVNLYRPYQIMKEMHEVSMGLISRSGLELNSKLSLERLSFWWTFWIINSILGQILFRITLKAETIEQLIISTQLGMFCNFLGIPLAILTVFIIKNYATVEPQLIEVKRITDELAQNEEIN